MSYREIIEVHPELRRFVLCYWHIRAEGDQFTFRHLPKVQNLIVWNRGGVVWVDSHAVNEKLFVLTPQTVAQEVKAPRANLYGVSFVNDGLFRLTNLPGAGLLPEGLKQTLETLTFYSLESFSIALRKKMLSTMNFEDTPCSRAMDHILRTKGCETLSQVYHECGVSERTFQRFCKLRIGLSPKQLVTLTRINYYLEEVLEKPEINWMEIVVKHAYYDQSHLIHEFKRFARMSPTQLKHERDTLYHHIMS
ncbi:helix-turn-helix domain-containing protein [Marinoscillum furvescens]|uniref:Helix-turn-helix protein n=1 Tax=Marinoscillum furvescens DSM 4134 TaxID=1122208 RepID=A0A3D9L5S8_MARFU|nr:AraC family transcriptional regulator [Marinoscillum furvescens]RED98953.1 helix-turn-helix protein [Marinoscillum furvescens DSM 4134]